MKVDKSHHLDKREPDANGWYEYYYDYHIYEFSEENLKLIARSYKNKPEARFLRLEEKTIIFCFPGGVSISIGATRYRVFQG